MTKEYAVVAIRNICPRGDLDVPLIGATVVAGESVDVDVDHARRLLEQVDNWELVNPADAQLLAPPVEAPAPPPADAAPPAAAVAPPTPVVPPEPVDVPPAPSFDPAAPADTEGVPA